MSQCESFYNAKNAWNNHFLNKEIEWPSEAVIRIFKGKYPNLNINKDNFNGKKICDIGCGDGKNLILFKSLGFDVYGIEITSEIVNKIKLNMQVAQIDNFDIRVGTNRSMPFENEYFDYILSWNACYYMGREKSFSDYVKEFARVIKKDGTLVLSIPKKSCFIYSESKEVRDGYRLIERDPRGVRSGEVLRVFEDEKEIKDSFSEYFKNFVFASISDDWFGLNLHWHIVVCQKI